MAGANIEFDEPLAAEGSYSVTMGWGDRSATCRFELPAGEQSCERPLSFISDRPGEISSVYVYDEYPERVAVRVARDGSVIGDAVFEMGAYRNSEPSACGPCERADRQLSLSPH